MKKRVKEIVQRVFLYFNLMIMNLAFGIPVYAEEKKEATNKLLTSTPVQGLLALIEDAQGVALAVEAVLVVALLIYTKIKEQASDDDEKPKYKKQFKGIIVAGVVIVSLTALVPLILSYFVAPVKEV